jgi:microcystin-dependent protein
MSLSRREKELDMDAFLAEIRIFPFNFAPTGWAWCDGQLMPILQNTALFSLLGTTYGGDGISTFALPDLRGKVPMHSGQGSGLSPHDLGEHGGSETVILQESEIAGHAHSLLASSSDGELTIPTPQRVLAKSTGQNLYASAASLTPMAPGAISSTGGGAPHNNLQPYLTLHFCIALQGEYPTHT